MDNTYGAKSNDGSYVVTEQGDLGLGLTSIEEGKDIEEGKEETSNLTKLV